jgi:hypothetical protein
MTTTPGAAITSHAALIIVLLRRYCNEFPAI